MSGWNATDRWTQLLKEEEEVMKDKPKVSYYEKRRHTFFKLGYNENHIPGSKKYLRIRAANPKLKEWEEP